VRSDFLYGFWEQFRGLSTHWSSCKSTRYSFSDFKQTWIFWTGFRKILRYEISWKSVQWVPIHPLRADRQTDAMKWVHIKRTDKITGKKGMRWTRRKGNRRMRRIMRWERTDCLKRNTDRGKKHLRMERTRAIRRKVKVCVENKMCNNTETYCPLCLQFAHYPALTSFAALKVSLNNPPTVSFLTYSPSTKTLPRFSSEYKNHCSRSNVVNCHTRNQASFAIHRPWWHEIILTTKFSVVK